MYTIRAYMHFFLATLYINSGKPYIEVKTHKEYLHQAALEALKEQSINMATNVKTNMTKQKEPPK